MWWWMIPLPGWMREYSWYPSLSAWHESVSGSPLSLLVFGFSLMVFVSMRRSYTQPPFTRSVLVVYVMSLGLMMLSLGLYMFGAYMMPVSAVLVVAAGVGFGWWLWKLLRWIVTELWLAPGDLWRSWRFWREYPRQDDPLNPQTVGGLLRWFFNYSDADHWPELPDSVVSLLDEALVEPQDEVVARLLVLDQIDIYTWLELSDIRERVALLLKFTYPASACWQMAKDLPAALFVILDLESESDEETAGMFVDY